MREGRKELYEWLWKVRESGIIERHGLRAPGVDILEIGTGDHLANYAIFKDKYEFTMSDNNPDMLNKYKDRFKNYIQFDILNPPGRYENFSFYAGIIACEILEHIPIPKMLNAIKNLRSFMATWGVLVITTPFWYRIHESTQGDPTITETNLYDYCRVTPSGLKNLFQEAGFKEFYVSALHKPKDYPYSPTHVVGWAMEGDTGKERDAFNCTVPENWIELQIQAEKEIGYEG